MKNSKETLNPVLKSFKSEQRNVFTEEINEIPLNSTGDKRMQLVGLIQTYTYWTKKDVVSKKEEIKCSYIIKWYKKGLTFDVL